MAIKYCEQCGTQLGEGAKYCKRCAAPVKAALGQCPACGTMPQEGDAVCRACGAHLLVEKALDTNKQNAILRVEARYHPVWIAPAALTLTLALAAAVRFAQQLFAGAIPREGYFWSSIIAAAFAIVAFYISRALTIRSAGWRGDEFRADKKDAAVAARAGGKAGRKGTFGALLLARPAVAVLSLLTAAALILGQPRFTAPDLSGVGDALAEIEDNIALPTPVPAQTPAYAREVRLNGIWTNIVDSTPASDGYVYMSYLLLTDGGATFGTCTDAKDVEAYALTGTAAQRMSVDAEYEYAVSEAVFVPLVNREEDYLASCTLHLTDPGNPTASMTWKLDFYHTLGTSGDISASGANIQAIYYGTLGCAVSWVPTRPGYDGTRRDAMAQDIIWGFWVDPDDLKDYTGFDYHEHHNIAFVYFGHDGRLFTGRCTGADETIGWFLNQDEDASFYIDAEYTYAIESVAYTLPVTQTYPIVDSCVVSVTGENGDTFEWIMEPGSLLTTHEGDRYVWGTNREWEAP